MQPTIGRVVLVTEWTDGVAGSPEAGVIVHVWSETVVDVHVLGHRARVVTSAGQGETITGTTWAWPPRV